MSAMLRSRPVLRRFVTCALTRSTLPRRLFPSELLRWNSTAAASSEFVFKPTRTTGLLSTLPKTDFASEPSSEPAADEKDPALLFHTLSEQVHPATLKAITVRPFKHTHMSPVQAQILPMLPTLALPHTEHPGAEHPRDLLVKAKTGTGKTMAFLVPAIEARVKALAAHTAEVQKSGVTLSRADVLRAEAAYARTHVGCLIISPTRELATQIAVEATNLTSHHPGWQTQLLLGGESKMRQLREWRGRKDVVVATPGRILDLLNTESAVADAIRNCNLLILDEADTLLDMGFRDDITRLLTYLPPQPQRQTFLFSATVSRAIQQIAQASLSPTHKFVNCVAHDDSPVHAHIPQYHTVLRSGADLLPHVLRLIANDQLQYNGKATTTGEKPTPSKIIIFLSTTNMVTLFSSLLRKSLSLLPTPLASTTLYEIHSKRDMKARQRVSQSFRASTAASSILITSDVSARGVDYPGVTRVIQIGCPSGRDVYVHRVGRTGRGGRKEGRGDLVLMEWEMGFVRGKLADVGLKPVTQEQTGAELYERAEKSSGGKYGRAKIEELQTSAVQIATSFGGGAGALGHAYSHSPNANDKMDDIRTAFSSQVGFFLGKAHEQGLDIHAVIKGMKKMWVDMWGLEREPYLSRNLEAMVNGGGSGGYGRNARTSSSNSSGGYQGGGYQGNSTRDSISGHFASRAPPGQESGYGYPKGARQGARFSNAGQYAQSRESSWESGGASRFSAGSERPSSYSSSDRSSSSYSDRSSSPRRPASTSNSYDFRSRGSKAAALERGFPSRGSNEYVSGRGRTHGRNAAFSAGVRSRSGGREDFE